MTQIKFKITNLDCPACVTLSIGALREIPGVTEAKVNLFSGNAIIEAENEISQETIIEALRTVDKEVAFN